jgi:LytS/YehU family sensor histidine kinase
MFEDKPILSILISNVIVFGLISIMALGAYQNKIAMLGMKEQAENEKNVLIKEIEFLKNQFNYEATFNFLQCCYNEINSESKEIGKAINIFTQILNYSLNNSANEKVLLKNEIEYIKDYISIQKLLDDKIQIDFSLELSENSLDFIIISPRILITFVENVFKHGNLHSLINPVEIKLYASHEYIEFKVKNEKDNSLVRKVSGIGYVNLKQQLELHYENKYVLNVYEDNTIYSTSLKLSI